MILDATLVDKIIEELRGTSMREGVVCDEYDLDLDDVEEAMVKAGYDRCSVCGVWCETGELDGDYACESCHDRVGDLDDDESEND